MSRKVFTHRLFAPFLKILFVSAIASFLVPALHAEEIRIKVVNGRSGKPVKNECLVVWIGRHNLIAPTNTDGVVVLDLEGNTLRAEAIPPRACGGMAVPGPKLLPNGTEGISITGDYYVPCQEYAKPARGEAVTPNLVNQLMPAYSIKKILESGVTASNTCGKIRAEAKPGELILFMRHTTWLERLRR